MDKEPVDRQVDYTPRLRLDIADRPAFTGRSAIFKIHVTSNKKDCCFRLCALLIEALVDQNSDVNPAILIPICRFFAGGLGFAISHGYRYAI